MQVFIGSRKQIFSLLDEHPSPYSLTFSSLLLSALCTVQQKMATECPAPEYSVVCYLKHFFLYSNCRSNQVNQGGLEGEYLIFLVSDLNTKLLVGMGRHHQ